VFRFAMIDADNAESVGVSHSRARTSSRATLIQQRPAGDVRVVNVLEAEREDRLPVLILELADGLGYLSD
jgi:hypothetical protein